MVGIAFSMLVLIGLVSIAFNFAIRIRLMTHDTTRGKLAWLSCGSSEAWDGYNNYSRAVIFLASCDYSFGELSPPQ